MALNLISIGPWRGIDNVHSADAQTFQIPGELEKRRAALVAATDVDLDDDGWPATRNPATLVGDELVAGLKGFSAYGLLLVQDEGVVYSVAGDGTRTALVSDLDTDDPVRLLAHDERIWWSNREYLGLITADGVATNWGQAVPSSPTLGTVAGSLPAGRYQVICTTLDGNGVESGCGLATAIALNGSQDLTVDLVSYDANAVTVRVYVAAIDSSSPSLLWAANSAVGDLPATVSTVGNSRYPVKTRLMRGPVPCRTLGAYKDMILLGRNQWVMPSSGFSKHLFRTGNEALYFPGAVQGIAGLESGVYVATERGLFWIEGETLQTFRRVQIDSEYYARDTFVLDGWKLPVLQTSARVAMMMNQHGLVIGLPGGQISVPLEDSYRFGDVTNKRLSIAYLKDDSLRQIFVSLIDAVQEDGSYWDVTNPSPPYGELPTAADIDWTIRHTAVNTTANDREFIVVDAAGVTITLPAVPVSKYAVAVSVGAFVDTVVDGNGNDILGSGANFTVDVEQATVVLFWPDGTKGWVVL